jgi:hypothetical protein
LAVEGGKKLKHTLHNQLMRSRHKSESIIMVERFGYVLPECVSCTTRRDAPSTTVVWVGPKQITHRSFMGHFLHSVDGADVVKGVDGGRETAMQAKYL